MNLIQRTATRLKERLTPRGLVLMYHRIAEPDLDPWGLCVSPGHFAEQLEVINRYFRPLSLQELLRQLQRGKVPNRSIVVTFDDGYADNLQVAKPLLEYFDIPATIFLVTEALVEERNFWWDELEWALLQPGTLPDCLILQVGDQMREWHLGDARRYSLQDRGEDRQRRPWDALPGSRLAFFYLIWQYLLGLSKPERFQALDAIRAWSGMDPNRRAGDRALRKDELHVLGAGKLIELGAHTMTHASLLTLPAAEQVAEIQGSRRQLEELITRPVTSFSYPHGEYSPGTLDLVRDAGFHSASTTNFKCVFPGADPFQLPRFQVDDWDGDVFLRRLSRWYAFS